MAGLVLLWLVLGLGIGTLAASARLGRHASGKRAWLLMPGIGAAAALLGGILGSLLLSRFYGTATAAWAAVLGVVVGAWVLTRVWK
jgi:hypothetical protein